MKTGTVAISVDAIPTEVCWKASRLSETPKKGPKKEPMAKGTNALLFRNAKLIDRHSLAKLMITIKPNIPVIALICEEANGS